MGHYYSYKAWELDDLTIPQLEMYLERIPNFEYKQHVHEADLMSLVGNATGGKSKGENRDPNFEPFTRMDFLHHFARPRGLEAYQRSDITPETAEVFIRLSEAKQLPSWVISAAPWPQIRRAC